MTVHSDPSSLLSIKVGLQKKQLIGVGDMTTKRVTESHGTFQRLPRVWSPRFVKAADRAFMLRAGHVA